MKMATGHHGANHPVKTLADDTVMITSQNHGFAVDIDTLPDNLKVTHVSLFDGTLQGIDPTDVPPCQPPACTSVPLLPCTLPSTSATSGPFSRTGLV